MKQANRLAIDLRMLHSSGIGTYLRNLLPLIIVAYSDSKFYLLGESHEIANHSWAHASNVTLVDCSAPIYSVAEQFELVRAIPKDITLVWSPHYNIPLLYKGKLLVTVHDVFHLAMPQYVAGLHRRLYARGMFNSVRRKANAILCNSYFTSNELMRLAGQRHQGIHTVHLGLDDFWFHAQRHQSPLAHPFLLFVGNVKPHKNVVALLNAFKLIKDKIPHHLVVVGKREGFITGDEAVPAKAKILGSRVHFTDQISDELLRRYFTNADALVFPSFYEGFGLPPLEAMACGCPVIVSDAASLPEVCGNAALYCNPHSARDIADKIMQLTNDVSLRMDLRQRGLEHCRWFTWEKCARRTTAVIEEVLNN